MLELHPLFGVRVAVRGDVIDRDSNLWWEGYLFLNDNTMFFCTSDYAVDGSVPHGASLYRTRWGVDHGSWSLGFGTGCYPYAQDLRVKPLKLNEGVNNEGKIYIRS